MQLGTRKYSRVYLIYESSYFIFRIEDPFEDYYNVGHIIEGWNLMTLKSQFLV